MTRRCVIPASVLLAVSALSACNSSPPGAQDQAKAATRNACQKRAEQNYEQQNRASIYSPPPSVNTPFSANYLPDLSDRGLSELFAHDRMVSNCVGGNTGFGGGDASPSTSPAR